ncbi:hypothetical protein D0Y65_023115 [Glycine soja]|uniref:Uncharacterized protein n=1 Tax=Glycine soja TaxID=3848 RepID=A0A445IWW7_GLYSO|nr:hypothetical protein JHK87_023905 [Glycine soja]RZB90510.1 hypothetical protein D0Y65_023115 [Glycine soja]
MVLHPYGCCIACPSCSRNHDPHNDHTPSPPSRSSFRRPLMCRRWSWDGYNAREGGDGRFFYFGGED